MKKFIFGIVCAMLGLTAWAQPYGNEWINYSSTYYYFGIAKDGVYRIDYTTLENAGIPVTSLQPANIQLFGRGQQVYLHIEGGQDNSFDPGDYIEFYAQRNDAWLDTLLYRNGLADMPDTYYSLYNDTAYYYLTWNSGQPSRRMQQVTDTNYSAHTALPYIWTTRYARMNTRYLQGELQAGASSSFFTAGEGWFSEPLNALSGDLYDHLVTTPQAYTGPGAPDARAIAVAASLSNASIYTGPGNHHLRIQYGNSLVTAIDTIYTGYKLIKTSFPVPVSALGSSNTRIRYALINDLGASADYQSIASSTIRYPHTLNAEGSSYFTFSVPYNFSQSRSYLPLSNPGSSAMRLYEVSDTVKRITLSPSGGLYRALVPNKLPGQEAQCVLLAESEISSIPLLRPVNGTGQFTDYTAAVPDSVYLILTETSLFAAAQQYAAYRSSFAGGGFNTLVVDVEELYHQYGSGVRKHILGLRRFCDQLIDAATVKPAFLFLLGKSIREATESSNGTFFGTRHDPVAFRNNLVPSYGYPSSDNLITAGLSSSPLVPSIPTGRFSAITPQHVLDYLSKVQQYEAHQNPSSPYTIEDKDWMKHVMHFGGGSTVQEQNDFAGYLSTYEAILSDTLFGAEVHTYLKRSSDPIDPVQFDGVQQRLNEGVSLMTFFGHSSASGFDQNLDEPENWTNYGKYPILLGNACYTGDIHQPDAISASEKFVKVPQRGVVAFMSSTKLGFVGPLHLFSTTFYRRIGTFDYGHSSGQVLRNTIQDISVGAMGYLPMENACTQMTLHGDPALKFNTHPRPELVVRNQDIYFEPAAVTLGDDSLTVNVIVSNIGRAVNDAISVELRRSFPNGADSVYTKVLNGLHYKDTVAFRMPVLHNIATGINVFDALVDIPDFVPEVYDEINNNQATATLFVNANGISPVYPYQYAIVPSDTLTLQASTFNPIAPLKNYRFEIDTTDLFNSPQRRYQQVASVGGVVKAPSMGWRFASSSAAAPLQFTDSTVYFWRVSPDSSSYTWNESSFQYIRGKQGWGQSHFFQFKSNALQSLNYDRPGRRWYWDQNIRRIGCEVYGNASNTSQFYGTLWTIDGSQQDYSGCGIEPAIHVAVIDPVTLEPWGTHGCDPDLGGACPTSCVMLNADHQFGSFNDGCACRGRVEYYFIFRQTSTAEIDSLISMINNHVPNGYYVLLYTWRYAEYSLWTPELYNLVNDFGATTIQPGQPNAPWIAFGRKGDPASTRTVVGDSISAFITLNDTLRGFDFQGSMTSVKAGPALKWETLYWQQRSVETPSTDSARISLVGVRANGTEQLLYNNLFTFRDSLVNLAALVDAAEYPFVKLRGWYTDSVFFTPAQTQRWQLIYQPVPEAAVDGNSGLYFTGLSDTLQEGQHFSLSIPVRNVSEYDMDSLLVHYWIEDRNRVKHYQTYPRADSLRAGALLRDTVSFSTAGYPGLNSIWMEVNPVPLGSPVQVYDQPEQYHFNNYAQIPFYVKQDITNPILDVTFDGIHILNGDVVSAETNILISLNDENPFLVMNSESDTAFFAVYLTDPGGTQRRVYFRQNGQEILRWTPSSGPNGKFRIEYAPECPIDGRYRLFVQASDKSGNASGKADYKIDFMVDRRPSITEVMNYPNPFTTKTRFVFTLTGVQPPDYLKIQIITITGKIVKEITLDELGPVHIGRNITDYYWDGTDQFGDRLANGVYLYRVIARLNGENMEKRASGADSYFHKGFGKMYLMR